MAAMMAAALLTTGCAAFQNMSKTGQGATIGGGGGAVAGAAIGAMAGGGKGAAIGTAVGAGLGAGVGALIGRRMDKQKAEHDLIRRAGKYLEYPDPFSRLPFPTVPGSILSSRRRSLEPENRHDSVSQREQPLDPARARPDERFRQIGQPDPVAGIRHREPVAIDIVPSRAFRIEQRLFPYFHSDR